VCDLIGRESRNKKGIWDANGSVKQSASESRIIRPTETYIRKRRKNIWDIATTAPIKKPTAMEL
jgi:hypothetical protein